MSYSKRELYALGEPLGDSVTELKVTGDRIYGGGGKGKKPAYVPITPANVSTGFGTATANPRTGQYSYTLDPRLAEMRDIFYGATDQFMPTAEEQQFAQNVSQTGMGIAGRGNEFLNQALGLDTAQVGQDYYNQIQNLMSMDRAQEEARLADTLFKSGRTGAAVGTQGGYLNPEQFALLKAREQANQQLAINANQYGRAQREGDVGFATRLMGTGLDTYGAGKNVQAAPYNQMAGIFGLGTNIEGLGLKPLEIAGNALNAQLAQQKIQQQQENDRVKGGKGGSILGTIGSAVGGYFGGPAGAQIGGQIGSSLGGGGGGGGDSLAGSIGSYFGSGSSPSIFSGSSPSSGFGSYFGGTSGFGNANAGTPYGTWTPIDTNIGMGGYSAPANYGGGFGYPRY
jgi:hypothetical protein